MINDLRYVNKLSTFKQLCLIAWLFAMIILYWIVEFVYCVSVIFRKLKLEFNHYLWVIKNRKAARELSSYKRGIKSHARNLPRK